MPNVDAITGHDATEGAAIYQAVVARIMIIFGEYPGLPTYGTRLPLPRGRGFIPSLPAVKTEVIKSLEQDAEWYGINSVEAYHVQGTARLLIRTEVVDVAGTTISAEVQA